MALSKINNDLDVIQKLDDLPNDEGGLTPAQFKAKFDEAGNAIKTFVNNTLTTEIDTTFATKAENNLKANASDVYTKTELNNGQLDSRYYTETELNAGQLDSRYYTESEADAKYATKAEVQTVILGQIPDGSLAEAKLSFDVATQAELNTTTTNLTNSINTKANDLELLLWMGAI